jgi:hypothetical protein
MAVVRGIVKGLCDEWGYGRQWRPTACREAWVSVVNSVKTQHDTELEAIDALLRAMEADNA